MLCCSFIFLISIRIIDILDIYFLIIIICFCKLKDLECDWEKDFIYYSNHNIRCVQIYMNILDSLMFFEIYI